MADANKRNSAAGKIATPRTGSAPPAPPMLDTLEALSKAVGARIKLTTTAPHSQMLEGSLYTACTITNLLAVNTRTSSGNAASQPGDYHIVPVSRIQSFQITSLAGDGAQSITTAQPAIVPVDTKRLQEREETRIRKLKEEDDNRGKGVSKEAQEIYDSLRRVNVPIRWHNAEMIVHEFVIITPPYRPEDCRSAKDKSAILTRVKQILEGERRKLKERESATAPRKGG
nr:hypothetical protein B0A51_13811 [Rachicladosporium sp. CCFEE 5018]